MWNISTHLYHELTNQSKSPLKSLGNFNYGLDIRLRSKIIFNFVRCDNGTVLCVFACFAGLLLPQYVTQAALQLVSLPLQPPKELRLQANTTVPSFCLYSLLILICERWTLNYLQAEWNKSLNVLYSEINKMKLNVKVDWRQHTVHQSSPFTRVCRLL